ncbi:hypothetical protein FMUND_15120 [Fusarium mundagurra]|uniref:Uncharacterized protein n=1 Tax=Fusarium mundagurra TaxID=1567541 RepID=A0A8H6CZ51_9HYPO|nr:hypothetical protein FMUND_15120 [Fusarium mundagurra]
MYGLDSEYSHSREAKPPALVSLSFFLAPARAIFQLEPGTPAINSSLWNFAVMLTGGNVKHVHLLLLVPALFFLSVILQTRFASLTPSARRLEIEVAWPVVLMSFGFSLAFSRAYTDQGLALRIWVPVYCFTFGLVPYLLQLVVVKFPSCAIRIVTILAWILVVETLSTSGLYGEWSESLFMRHRSTKYLILAETFGYAMRWVKWPSEDPSAT